MYNLDIIVFGEKYEKIISWLIVVITVFPLLTTGVNCNADNRSKNYKYTIESTKVVVFQLFLFSLLNLTNMA